MSQIPKKHLKCGFVHVPRTGGASIREALSNYSFINNKGGHLGRAYMEDSLRMSREKSNQYFWFAFVRNPWDRFVSAYEYLKRRNDSSVGQRFARLTKPFKTFKDFVVNIDGALVQNEIATIGRAEGDNYINNRLAVSTFIPHFSTQCMQLREGKNTKIKLDFIGRFENLQEDFNIVCKNVGIEPIALPRINYSNRTPYQEYYDEETRGVIFNEYYEDIKMFGYRYD